MTAYFSEEYWAAGRQISLSISSSGRWRLRRGWRRSWGTQTAPAADLGHPQGSPGWDRTGLGGSGAAGAEQCCQPSPAREAAAPLRPPCAPAVGLAAKAGSRVLQTRCLKTTALSPPPGAATLVSQLISSRGFRWKKKKNNSLFLRSLGLKNNNNKKKASSLSRW